MQPDSGSRISKISPTKVCLQWRHDSMWKQDPLSAYLPDTLGSFWSGAIFKQLHVSTDGKVCVVGVAGAGGGPASMLMPTVLHMHQTCTKIGVQQRPSNPLTRRVLSFDLTNPRAVE